MTLNESIDIVSNDCQKNIGINYIWSVLGLAYIVIGVGLYGFSTIDIGRYSERKSIVESVRLKNNN